MLGNAPLEALGSDLETLEAIRRDVLALLQDAGQGRVDVVRIAARWAQDELPLRLRCIENCLTGRVCMARVCALTRLNCVLARSCKLALCP